MKEALLYEKLPHSQVQCHTCQWHCKINDGRLGVCGAYRNIDGRLFNLNYALVSSAAADPIEKKPLFHFHPATTVFSMGTFGCNFQCKHCQNWEISRADVESSVRQCHEVSPEYLLELTAQYRCQGVAWTYNEPGIWLEYILDTAQKAKEAGLYTAYVTNGYSSQQALDTIGPYLDAYRVDIKGFSDDFYRDIPGVPHWKDILTTAERAKNKWDMHVEVVTNVIPGFNDDPAQLEAIAAWIRNGLGELTPWHVTRFYPSFQLTDLPPTPVESLERACEIGEKAGLKFIYTGNVPGHHNENTVCYNCGNLAIERRGYETKILGLNGSYCSNCGADLNIRN